jgi:hypothetical protein
METLSSDERDLASQPNPNNWHLEKAGPILGIWWFFWIANSVVGQVVFRMSRRAQEISEIMNVNLISQVSEVLSIPLAIVTWLLINNISNMQKAQIESDVEKAETAEDSDLQPAK